MTRKQIEAALVSARATVASLEALLESVDAHDPSSDLLDAKTVKQEYDIGRDALKAAAKRGELKLHRGTRDKLLVERGKLEAWRRSQPYKPTQRRPVADLKTWEAEATRALGAGS